MGRRASAKSLSINGIHPLTGGVRYLPIRNEAQNVTVVLVIVALGWVVFLGSVVKERMGTRVGDSVHSFHSQLSTLERRVGPRRSRSTGFSAAPMAFGGSSRPMSPQARRRAARQAEFRRRRRDVLFGLVGVFAFSLLLVAISPGPITALACLATAGLLAGCFKSARRDGLRTSTAMPGILPIAKQIAES